MAPWCLRAWSPWGSPSQHMCVCACAHAHVCLRAWAHTCMSVHVRTRACTRVHACACMHAYVCMWGGRVTRSRLHPALCPPHPLHTLLTCPRLWSCHSALCQARLDTSHPATSDSSPPAPPAPSPAAGGPSLGTLGPVQALGLRSLGSLEPDGQLLEPLGVLQLCHLDLGETPGASLPTPGWAAQRPRAYRWPSPGPAGGLGVLYTRLTSGPCLGWNPAHRPPK